MFCVDTSKKLHPVYFLAVLAAHRKIDWKKFRGLIGTKKVGLVKLEKVQELTGCVNGAVPPFGSLFDAHTYCDESLIEQGDTINFNAGLRTKSMQMNT
jgi:Ala-tRNA(Pro) deacylase